jgi:hypothetical protein
MTHSLYIQDSTCTVDTAAIRTRPPAPSVDVQAVFSLDLLPSWASMLTPATLLYTLSASDCPPHLHIYLTYTSSGALPLFVAHNNSHPPVHLSLLKRIPPTVLYT